MFSPDGAQLLTVTTTGAAQVWVTATGEARPLHYEGAVTAVAFSPDGTTLALATEEHAVQLSDLHSNTGLEDPRGPLGADHGGRVLA